MTSHTGKVKKWARRRPLDEWEPELTDAVLLVPVEFLSWWTHTLITTLCVYAAVLTASVVDAALIDI